MAGSPSPIRVGLDFSVKDPETSSYHVVLKAISVSNMKPLLFHEL